MGVEEATVEALTDAMCTIFKSECGDLNRVALPALGSFQGVKKEETVVRDLTTGQRLLLPPAIEVEFAVAGRLRNSVAEAVKTARTAGKNPSNQPRK